MQKSDEIKNIAMAMATFRKNLKQPVKSADNPFFKSKYVTLEGVVKVIDDALKDSDLSYFQEVTSDGDQISVSTIIVHKNGEWIQFDPLNVPVSKNDAQAFGSAETYARRYTLSAVFGVTSDIDDDGNAAAKATTSQKPSYHRNNSGTNNGRATDRQVKMYFVQIGKIAKFENKKDEVIESKMSQYLDETFHVKKFNDLSGQQASKVIKIMMERANKAQLANNNNASSQESDNNNPAANDDPFAAAQ